MGHLFVTLGEDKSLPLFYWLEAVHFFPQFVLARKKLSTVCSLLHCCATNKIQKVTSDIVKKWRNTEMDSSLIHIITDPRLYEI